MLPMKLIVVKREIAVAHEKSLGHFREVFLMVGEAVVRLVTTRDMVGFLKLAAVAEQLVSGENPGVIEAQHPLMVCVRQLVQEHRAAVGAARLADQ